MSIMFDTAKPIVWEEDSFLVDPRLRNTHGERAARLMCDAATVASSMYDEKADSWKRALESVDARELVYLGVRTNQTEHAEMLWIELENIDMNPLYGFSVSPVELQIKVRELSFMHPSASAVALWHCHFMQEGPSDVDIRFLPTWLVPVGIVHHTPTGMNSLYRARD